jgi:hypothetical protein
MTNSPLNGLIIRTAVARKPGLGFIFACDPEKEGMGTPHAISFKWKDSIFSRGECNYNVHTACAIKSPQNGLVNASCSGDYSVNTASGTYTGNVFDNSQPKKSRYGDLSRLSSIDGKAYAVGHGGMVYRMDDISIWTPIDHDLPDSFDIEGIHGFNSSDIYAVGLTGQVWHFDGQVWVRQDIPTNLNLHCVQCAEDGYVYIAGSRGILIRRRNQIWQTINQEKNCGDIWDLEWFGGDLYIATMRGLYELELPESLKAIDFGDCEPSSFYRMSVGENVLWSVGERDIVSFDGETWSKVV